MLFFVAQAHVHILQVRMFGLLLVLRITVCCDRASVPVRGGCASQSSFLSRRGLQTVLRRASSGRVLVVTTRCAPVGSCIVSSLTPCAHGTHQCVVTMHEGTLLPRDCLTTPTSFRRTVLLNIYVANVHSSHICSLRDTVIIGIFSSTALEIHGAPSALLVNSTSHFLFFRQHMDCSCCRRSLCSQKPRTLRFLARGLRTVETEVLIPLLFSCYEIFFGCQPHNFSVQTAALCGLVSCC